MTSLTSFKPSVWMSKSKIRMKDENILEFKFQYNWLIFQYAIYSSFFFPKVKVLNCCNISSISRSQFMRSTISYVYSVQCTMYTYKYVACILCIHLSSFVSCYSIFGVCAHWLLLEERERKISLAHFIFEFFTKNAASFISVLPKK